MGALIGRRLWELRMRAGETQAEFASRLGVPRSTYSLWETGQRMPDPETLRAVAEKLGVSVAYLVGETDDARPFETIGTDPTEGQALPVVPIPILGVIHAGDPIPAEEQIIGWTAIPADMTRGDEYFALRVRGDCMAGGTKPINEGDIVIVRRQPDVSNGEIAVVLWPDVSEAQLRRVYRRDGTVILRADNPAYPPEIVRSRELRILGVVVGIQTTPASAREVGL